MYNGIGLRTVRGSGTNGYVQRNLSYVRPAHQRRIAKFGQSGGIDSDLPKEKKANREILEHYRKRDIEVKLLEAQVRMEDRGVSEADINSRLAEIRKRLTREAERDIARARALSRPSRGGRSEGTHESAFRQERKNSALESALGIDKGRHETGAAFDRDLQEQKKQERIKAREEREKEERKRRKKEKKRRKKEAKKEKKRRKKREKERKKEERRRKKEAEKAGGVNKEQAIRMAQAEEAKHRERMAKLSRLRDLAEAAGDREKVRKIDGLEKTEVSRHERVLAKAKEQLGAEAFEKLRKQIEAGRRPAGERPTERPTERPSGERPTERPAERPTERP